MHVSVDGVGRAHSRARSRMLSTRSDTTLSIPQFMREYNVDSNAQIIRSSLSSRGRNSLYSAADARERVSEVSLNGSKFNRQETVITVDLDENRQSSFLGVLDEPEPASAFSDMYVDAPMKVKIVLQCLVITALIYLTWGLAFHGHEVGANLSASITSTVSSILLPDMLVFGAIGAYAGMFDVSTPSHLLCVCVMTCISGCLFEYFAIFAGRGGRLGTSAFVGCVVSLFVLWVCAIEGTDRVSQQTLYDSSQKSYSELDSWIIFNAIASNIIGAVSTFVLRRARPLLPPVVAGNAVSVLLIIIVDTFLVTLPATHASEAAGCLFQGSFVGMSSYAILPSLEAFVAAAGLSGVVSVAMYPLFPHGIGGKRGFMAFVGVVCFQVLLSAYTLACGASQSQYEQLRSDVINGTGRMQAAKSPLLNPVDGSANSLLQRTEDI